MHTLNHILRSINPLKNGYAEGCGFPCAVLSSGEDVSPSQRNWDAFFLDWRRLLKSFLIYALQQLALQKVILKVVALRCCDVLRRTCQACWAALKEDLEGSSETPIATNEQPWSYFCLFALVLRREDKRFFPVCISLSRLSHAHCLFGTATQADSDSRTVRRVCARQLCHGRASILRKDTPRLSCSAGLPICSKAFNTLAETPLPCQLHSLLL